MKLRSYDDLARPAPDLPAMPVDNAALQAWRQMFITFYKLQRRVEQIVTPRGLALSQFEALARVGLRPGMIQQELADELFLTKGNIGALLDRLESLGFIERRPDQVDKRMNRLHLTAEGKGMMTDLFAANRQLVQQMMSPLSQPQQRQLRSLLQLLENDA